jgi:lysophospholipase L1-like esterase
VKSLGLRPEFNEKAFRSALEQLVDRVRAGTGGIADICLLSGIPRLRQDCSGSAGTMEQIVRGVAAAAENKKTAFVDTFAVYSHLTAEEQKHYYADTIHPTAAGQEFLGNIIYDKLRAEEYAQQSFSLSTGRTHPGPRGGSSLATFT